MAGQAAQLGSEVIARDPAHAEQRQSRGRVQTEQPRLQGQRGAQQLLSNDVLIHF